jgi:RAB protein geranylgeranyltransferase component A
MKSIRILAIATILASMALAGCSKKEEVSHNTLEDARSASLNNGVTVAKAYIRENPRLKGMDVVGHSDEFQTSDCPQGSGWAYLSAMRQSETLVEADGKPAVEKIKLVCSTVSASLGCYRESDFKQTKFSETAGQCDRKLPFPLPKVIGKG